MATIKVAVALCEGSHPLPSSVTGSIFSKSTDMTDVDGLYQIASSEISADVQEINLYASDVDGAELLAVVGVCLDRGISLTVWHFNRNSGEYFADPVLRFDRCPYCGAAMLPSDLHCRHCGA